MTSLLAAVSAKRALLDRLIDDASLFPPARLAMEPAIRAHLRHRESAYAFVGGRFVVPASRLAEMPVAANPLACSVILDADIATVSAAESSGRIVAESFEVRAPGAEALAPLCDGVAAFAAAHRSVDLAIEIPYDGGYQLPPSTWDGIIAASGREGVRVLLKLRCGGEAAGLTPSVEDLSSAIVAARTAGVAIKATAGLHHPVRGRPAGETVMHGFLNVAVAAIGVHAGVLEPNRVSDVLAETESRAFVVDPAHIGWRDIAIDTDAVIAGRNAAFTSFGSCSFDEPVDDLRAVGMLA